LDEQEEAEGDLTTISPATTVSKSLRSTVPSSIVRQFRLSKGDKLRWRMEVSNNRLVIIVEPIKASGDKKKGR
jgi:hypothetical protein